MAEPGLVPRRYDDGQFMVEPGLIARKYADGQIPDRRAPADSAEFTKIKDYLDSRLDPQDVLLARMGVAMFAENADNEFNSPGLMTTMQKVSVHVDVMCGFAQGIKRLGAFAAWLGAAAAGVAGTVAAWRHLFP